MAEFEAEQTKDRRPKLGIGVLILNELDEVIVSQRIDPNNAAFDKVWQFPGGHQEYGESFEYTAQREVLEECGAHLPLQDIKFVTVMNVLYTEVGYHNVGIFMFCKVDKASFSFENREPEKCTDWRWVPWAEYF